MALTALRQAGTPGATIIALDGLIVETLDARAFAVADAVSAECAPCATAMARRLVPGRSLDEAVDAALHALRLAVPGSSASPDPTARDLAVLRARRSFTATVNRGLPLRDGVVPWLRARATQGRLVLRADSMRPDVDRLLAFSGVEDLVTFVRCSDDLPRVASLDSLARSWHAIAARLAALGVPSAACAALEPDSRCGAIAQAFVRDVAIVTNLP